MKKCIKCQIDKEDSCFYIGRNVCKLCISDYRKSWVKNNQDKMNEHSKNWRKNNIKKSKSFQKKWYENNKDTIKIQKKKYKELNGDKLKEVWKKYRDNNKEKLSINRKEYTKKNREKLNLYMVNMRNDNPILKLSHNLRSRIRQFLKTKNLTKHNKTFIIIGCTPQELKEHIEKQFVDDMSWENYGYYGWYVDHKIPLDFGKTEEEILKLCHYTNLQPMWCNDNLSKNNKV